MVRNPWRLTAEGVGFLYWWRQRELRMQGVQFRATMEPRARVWWTGQAARPYQWAVVTRQRGELPLRFLTLLDLNSGGTFWTTTQYPDGGGDLGLADDVAFPDVNADGRPELMTWGAAPEDSLFEQCRGCPRLLRERLWVERDGLFDAWDERLMPTPFSTFALFVRLLRQQNRAAASRLLADPARYDAAVREGWASGTARRSWKLEYSEPDQPWPTWLAFRHQGAAGKPLYVVHFVMKDGRWLIRDWIRPAPAGADTTRRPAPAAAGTKRP
jgi:hypothetical protein